MGPLIRIERLSKAFGGVQALDRVSFEIAIGEVHAVCGENGAGKSTLNKILSGSLPADSGLVFIGNEPIPPERFDAMLIAV